MAPTSMSPAGPINPCAFEGYETDLLQVVGSDELCTLPTTPPYGTPRGRPDYFQINRVPGMSEMAAVREITMPPVALRKSAFRLCLFRIRQDPYRINRFTRGIYHMPIFAKKNAPFWTDPGVGVTPSLKVTPLFNTSNVVKNGISADYRVEVAGGIRAEGEIVEVMRCLDLFCVDVVGYNYPYNTKGPDPSGVTILETEVVLMNDATHCRAQHNLDLYGGSTTGLLARVQNNEVLFSLLPRSLCMGQIPKCGFKFRLQVPRVGQPPLVVMSNLLEFRQEVTSMEQLRVNGKVVESGHRTLTVCETPDIPTCARVQCVTDTNCTVALQPMMRGTDVYSVAQDFYGVCGVTPMGVSDRSATSITNLFDPRTFTYNDMMHFWWNITSTITFSPTLYLSSNVDLELLTRNELLSSHGDVIRPVLFCDFLYNKNASSARVELMLLPPLPKSFELVSLMPMDPTIPDVIVVKEGDTYTAPAGYVLQARKWYAMVVTPFDQLGHKMDRMKLQDSLDWLHRSKTPSTIVVAGSVVGGAGNEVFVKETQYDVVEFMLDNNRGCERVRGGCRITFTWGFGTTDGMRPVVRTPVGTLSLHSHVRVAGTSLKVTTSSLVVANSRGIDVEVEAGEPCGSGCWYADEHHLGEAFVSLTSPLSHDGLQAHVPFSEYASCVAEARDQVSVQTPLNRFRIVTSRDSRVSVSRTYHPFAWNNATSKFVSTFAMHGSSSCHGCSVDIHTTSGADLTPNGLSFTLHEGEHNLSCAALPGGVLQVVAVNSATNMPSEYPRWPITISSLTQNVTYEANLGAGGLLKIAVNVNDQYIVETLPLDPVDGVGGVDQATDIEAMLSCTVTFDPVPSPPVDPFAPHVITSPDVSPLPMPTADFSGSNSSYFQYTGFNYKVPLNVMKSGITLFVSINSTTVKSVQGKDPFYVYPLSGPEPWSLSAVGSPVELNSTGGVTNVTLRSMYSHLDAGNITYGDITLGFVQGADVQNSSVLQVKGYTPVREACFLLCTRERVNGSATDSTWFVVIEHCSKINITVQSEPWSMGVELLTEPADVLLRPGGAGCSVSPTEIVITAATYFYVEGVNGTLLRHFVFDRHITYSAVAQGQLFEDTATKETKLPVVVRHTPYDARRMYSVVSFTMTGVFSIMKPEKIVITATLDPPNDLAIAGSATKSGYTWVVPAEEYQDFNISDAVVHKQCIGTPPLGPKTQNNYRLHVPLQEDNWSYLTRWGVGVPVPVQSIVVTKSNVRAWTYPNTLVRVSRHTQSGCGGSMPIKVFERDQQNNFVLGDVVRLRQGMAVAWVSFSAPCESCTLRLDLCYTTATTAANCLTPPSSPTAADNSPLLSNRVKYTKPFSVAKLNPSGAHITHQSLPASEQSLLLNGRNVSVVRVGTGFAITLEAVQQFGPQGWAAAVADVPLEVKVLNVWRPEGGAASLRYGNGGFLRELLPSDALQVCGGVLRETHKEYSVRAKNPTLNFVYTRPCSLCEVWIQYRFAHLTGPGAFSSFPLRTTSQAVPYSARVLTCGVKWVTLPHPQGRRRNVPFSVTLLYTDSMGVPAWKGSQHFRIRSSGEGNGAGNLRVTSPFQKYKGARLYHAEGGVFSITSRSSRAAYSAGLRFTPYPASQVMGVDYVFSVMSEPTQLVSIPTRGHHARDEDTAGLAQQYVTDIEKVPEMRHWQFYVYAADENLDRAVVPVGGPIETQLKAAYDKIVTEGAEVRLKKAAALPPIGYFDINADMNTSEWRQLQIEPLNIEIDPRDTPIVLWNGIVFPAGRLHNTSNVSSLVNIVTSAGTGPGLSAVEFEVITPGNEKNLRTVHGPGTVEVGVFDNYHSFLEDEGSDEGDTPNIVLAAATDLTGVTTTSGSAGQVDVYVVSKRNLKYYRAYGSGTVITFVECSSNASRVCDPSFVNLTASDMRNGVATVHYTTEGVLYDCRCLLTIEFAYSQNLQLDVVVPFFARSTKHLRWQWTDVGVTRYTDDHYALDAVLYDQGGRAQVTTIEVTPSNRIVVTSTPADCFVCEGDALANLGENICLPRLLGGTSGMQIRGHFSAVGVNGSSAECTITGLTNVNGVFTDFTNRVEIGASPPSPPSARTEIEVVPAGLVGGAGGAGETRQVFQNVFAIPPKDEVHVSTTRVEAGGDVAVVGSTAQLTVIVNSLKIFPLYLDCGFGFSGRKDEAPLKDTARENEQYMANVSAPRDVNTPVVFTLFLPHAGVWQCALKTGIYYNGAFMYKALNTSIPLPLLITIPVVASVEVQSFDYESATWRPLERSRWISGYALTLKVNFFDLLGRPYLPLDLERRQTVTVRSDIIPCYHEAMSAFRASCMKLGTTHYGWAECGMEESLERKLGGAAVDFFRPDLNVASAFNFSKDSKGVGPQKPQRNVPGPEGGAVEEEEEEHEVLEHHSCVDPYWGAKNFFLPQKRVVFRTMSCGAYSTPGYVPQLFHIENSALGPQTLAGLDIQVNETTYNHSTQEFEYNYVDNNHTMIAQGANSYDTLLRVVHDSQETAMSNIQLVLSSSLTRTFEFELLRPHFIHVSCDACPSLSSQLVSSQTLPSSLPTNLTTDKMTYHEFFSAKGTGLFDLDLEILDRKAMIVKQDSLSSLLVRARCLQRGPATPAPTASSRFFTLPPSVKPAAEQIPLFTSRSVFGSSFLSTIDESGSDGYYHLNVSEGRARMVNVSFDDECEKAVLEVDCSLARYGGLGIDAINTCNTFLKGRIYLKFIRIVKPTPAPLPTITPVASNALVASINISFAKGQTFGTFAPQEFEAKMTAELMNELNTALYAKVRYLCRLTQKGVVSQEDRLNGSVCRSFAGGSVRPRETLRRRASLLAVAVHQLEFEVVGDNLLATSVSGALQTVISSETSSIRTSFPGLSRTMNISSVPRTASPTPAPPTVSPATRTPFAVPPETPLPSVSNFTFFETISGAATLRVHAWLAFVWMPLVFIVELL